MPITSLTYERQPLVGNTLIDDEAGSVFIRIYPDRSLGRPRHVVAKTHVLRRLDLGGGVERLAGLARLWGTIKYFHPYLAYREIDWDAALIAAIPKVRAAGSNEEYRAAIEGMLGPLGDELTRTTRRADTKAAPKERRAREPVVPAGALHALRDGNLVIDCGRLMEHVFIGYAVGVRKTAKRYTGRIRRRSQGRASTLQSRAKCRRTRWVRSCVLGRVLASSGRSRLFPNAAIDVIDLTVLHNIERFPPAI